VRVVVTVGLFSAAYLAEVVRGGLQSVPQGQPQAALALGLGAWQTQRYVVVPQALMACYPSLVNSFVTLFKECSLVTIVSLFELTGSLSLALGGDVLWRPFYLEGYLFIAAIYWAYCYGLGRKSTWLSN
jgi:general L-amino acid transport system permease protein